MKQLFLPTTLSQVRKYASLRLSFSLLVLMIMSMSIGWGQTPNGFLDFGTTANGTTATTGNTGFGGVRIGSGGGGFTIQNPGQTIGTGAEIRGIAPTGGSINTIDLTSASYGTDAQLFTISFEVYFEGGSSGTWYFFAGNGASFGSTNGFTSAHIFTGIRWSFGTSNAITTSNRAGGSWSTISGTPFSQNTAYFVTIVGNNSSSTENYGASQSVAANTYDLWVNGSLVGNDLAKGALGANTAINAFRFYGESSTGNVATISLDNIRWYNTCVLPPTHLAFTNVPATGFTGTDLTSFNVEARSGSATGPVSTAFTGALTLAKASGSGNIAGTLSPSASSGVATYNNIQFDAADTYTITASGSAPIYSATSENVVISSSGTPNISVSTITSFEDQIVNTTSLEKSYIVSGSNLESDISITPPTGYEISTGTSENFVATNPIALSPTTGTVSSTTIYVRFKPTAVTSFSGDIQHTSTNATTQNVSVSGTGTSPETPTSVTAIAASHSQINLAFTPNGSNEVVVAVNSANTFGTPSGSYSVNDEISGGGTVIYKGTGSSYNHTGLEANTIYYYKVWTVDPLSFYSSGVTANATTSNLSATTATDGTSVSKTGFTANWGAVSGASGYRLDVATNNTFTKSNYTNIVSWDFPNDPDNATADGGISLNSSKTITTVGGTSSVTFAATGATTKAANATGWDSGNGTKYWLIEFDATGIFNLRVSSKQRASGTGPRDFKLQYRVGNSDTWTDVVNGSVTNASNFTNGVLSNVSLPTDCNNQSQIFLRWIMTSNTNVNGTSVASGGTSQIDDILIEGNELSFIDNFNNLSVSGTSQSVTGLTPNTTYYYRVRATSGNSTSANSNVVEVTTPGTEATDQFRTAASGNWGSTATWQSKDNTVDWFNATANPTADASAVLVQNGHEVTVAASAASSSLNLAPTSRLKINSGQTLSVTGSLTLQSTSEGTATIEDNGTLTVSGTTTVQQYLTTKTGESNTDFWWYIASPVSGATSASVLVDGSNNKFGTYNEATASYPQITATNVPLDPGKGYLAQINTTDTYEFTGTLNTGNVGPITLTRTNAALGKRGFNLVGNPYPSHIHWNSITGFGSSLRTDIRPTVWLRTRTATGTMDFDTFDGQDAVTKGKSGAMNGYIAPMQAFWVKVHADNTSPTITFTNAMRSARNQNAADNRLRTPGQTSRQILRLEVSNGVNFDQTVISTNEAAQDGYDFYDSDKMSAANSAIPEIYSLVADRELVIDKRNSITVGAGALLGFRPGQAGSFSIKATETTNLDNVRVILKDNLLNIETELQLNESYTFSTDATATNNRFSVEFRAPGVVTSVNEANAANTLVYVNDANQIAVQSTALTKAHRISVFNLAGQQLAVQQAEGKVTIINEVFNAGVYLVKVNNHLQKVIVK